jgi:hypothetical protein
MFTAYLIWLLALLVFVFVSTAVIGRWNRQALFLSGRSDHSPECREKRGRLWARMDFMARLRGIAAILLLFSLVAGYFIWG